MVYETKYWVECLGLYEMKLQDRDSWIIRSVIICARHCVTKDDQMKLMISGKYI
jgi:hypothetical protein